MIPPIFSDLDEFSSNFPGQIRCNSVLSELLEFIRIYNDLIIIKILNILIWTYFEYSEYVQKYIIFDFNLELLFLNFFYFEF